MTGSNGINSSGAGPRGGGDVGPRGGGDVGPRVAGEAGPWNAGETGPWNGCEIIVGVCGGIAAYKTAALVSQLVKTGAGVTVALSPAAEQFVGQATFAALSARAVASDAFDPQRFPLGPHIELASRASVMCVAPATANFLAHAALGLADDLLSTLYLSFTGRVLMAPAMNCEMWDKPAVQRNVARLKDDGVHFVGPDEGWLSCRSQGVGRMASPETIFQAIEGLLRDQSAPDNKSALDQASRII